MCYFHNNQWHRRLLSFRRKFHWWQTVFLWGKFSTTKKKVHDFLGKYKNEIKILFNFQLKGNIDDCSCNVDTVDHYNNHKIYPRLKSLLVKDYFRFYKTNLRSECPFWADDSKCAMKFCSVEACHDEDIPAGLKGSPHEKPTYKVSFTLGFTCFAFLSTWLFTGLITFYFLIDMKIRRCVFLVKICLTHFFEEICKFFKEISSKDILLRHFVFAKNTFGFVCLWVSICLKLVLKKKYKNCKKYKNW